MIAQQLPQRKKRKSFIAKFFGIGLLSLALSAVIIFLVYQNVRIGLRVSQLSKAEQNLAGQQNQLQTQKQSLEGQVQQMQTQDYQEKILRERGLYKKPNEDVITVILPSPAPAPGRQNQNKVWWNPLTW